MPAPGLSAAAGGRLAGRSGFSTFGAALVTALRAEIPDWDEDELSGLLFPRSFSAVRFRISANADKELTRASFFLLSAESCFCDLI